MNKAVPIAGLVVAAALAAPLNPARAQTINYGEVEELFGEPITTSATGSPVRRSEAPVTMDIISSEEIRRSGARTIPELLERLSGIDVFTWSNTSADVAVRGLNQGTSNRLLLLINGREQFTDALSTLVWQLLPIRLDEIRQIEVVKGPNSALYGFNAAAGVINIITFSPRYDAINVERLSGGSSGYGEVSIVRSQAWEGGGLRLSGGYSQIGESTFNPSFAPDRLFAKTNPSIARNFSVDLQQQVADATEIRLQAGVASASLRSQAQVPFHLGGLLATGSLTVTSDTKAGTLEGSINFNHYDLPDIISSFGARGPTNDVTVAKLQDLFKLGADDTIRIGVEYRHDTMTTWPAPGGHLGSDDVAVSATWIHAFTPDLSLLNAVRGDHYQLSRSGTFVSGSPYTNNDFDRTITDGSFNSALTWRPTQLDSIRVSVARGLQIPSLSEFGIQGSQVSPFQPPFQPTLQTNFLGSPTLPPSTVMHYELSYERQLKPLDMEARVAAYHQDIRALRDVPPFSLVPGSLAPGSPTPLAQAVYVVLGNATVDGLEADLKGSFGSGWRWSANYSYETITTNAPVFTRDYAGSGPRSKVNLQLGYTYGDWEVDGYLRYIGQVFVPQQVGPDVFAATRVPDFVQVQGRLAYHILPKLLIEAIVASSYADNPIARQQTQGYVSLVANF